MSLFLPARISEDDILGPDMMFSDDPSFNVVMNILDNGDFSLPTWALDQSEFPNFDLSIDECNFGPIPPFQDTVGVDGEGRTWQPDDTTTILPHAHNDPLNVPSWLEPTHTSSPMLFDVSDEGNCSLPAISAESAGIAAIHGQSQDGSATTPVYQRVNASPPEGQLQTPNEPETYCQRSQEVTRKRRRTAEVSHEKAVCSEIHEGYRKRKQKAKPIPQETWDLMKFDITNCYITEDKKLNEVKEMLEEKFQYRLEHCDGKVEEKQILDQLKKWKIQKNVRPKQREYIIRKHLERSKMEGKRPLKFFVRGVEISPTKIERWLKIWIKTRQDSHEGRYECGISVASGVFCKTVSELSFKNFTLTKATQTLTTLTETPPWHPGIKTPGVSTVSNEGTSTDLLDIKSIEPWDPSEMLEGFLLKAFETALFGLGFIDHSSLSKTFIDLVLESQTYRPWLKLLQKLTPCKPRYPQFNRCGTNKQWIWSEDNSEVVLKTIIHEKASQTFTSRERIMVFLVISPIVDRRSLCAWVDLTLHDKLVSMQQKRIFTYNHADRFHFHESERSIEKNDPHSLGENIDLQIASPNDGWNTSSSLLKIASFRGQYERTCLLLNLGAIVENGTDYSCVLWDIWIGCFHCSAWSLEIFERYRLVSDLVIQHGASVQYCVNATLEEGNLLHLPESRLWSSFGDCNYEFSDVLIRYFIQIGCNLEYRNVRGRTPLLHAIRRNTSNRAMGYISALINSGANVHATDDERMGCFHLSIQAIGQYQVFGRYHLPWDERDSGLNKIETLWRVLLKAGCDPWATNNYGKTAMDCIRDDGLRASFSSLIRGESLT